MRTFLNTWSTHVDWDIVRQAAFLHSLLFCAFQESSDCCSSLLFGSTLRLRQMLCFPPGMCIYTDKRVHVRVKQSEVFERACVCIYI